VLIPLLAVGLVLAGAGACWCCAVLRDPIRFAEAATGVVAGRPFGSVLVPVVRSAARLGHGALRRRRPVAVVGLAALGRSRSLVASLRGRVPRPPRVGRRPTLRRSR